MEKFICQKEEKCNKCGVEMPKGTFAYSSREQYLICEQCKEDEHEEDINFNE